MFDTFEAIALTIDGNLQARIGIGKSHEITPDTRQPKFDGDHPLAEIMHVFAHLALTIEHPLNPNVLKYT